MNKSMKAAVAAVAAGTMLSFSGSAAEAVPVKSQILPAPGGFVTGWATRVVVVATGDTATFTNIDAIHHKPVSDAVIETTDEDGETVESFLFAADEKNLGQSGDVHGLEKVAAGDYGFHCFFHPNMTGTIKVVDVPTAPAPPSVPYRRIGGR